jgi:lysophospholipase L1-like esterase
VSGRGKRALAALAIGLVAAFAAAEIALRVQGFDPIGEIRRQASPLVRASAVPGLRYELTPRSAGRQWDCDVRISSAGLRDREVLPKPRPGVRRVALLGDSIAFGIGLPVEDTFADRIERELAGERVEVLDLAVPGYDVCDHAAVLEHRALAFAPDLIVVAYAINDAGVHSLTLEHVEEVERYSSPLYELRVAQWLAQEAHRRRAVDFFEHANSDDEFERRFAGRIAPVDGELDSARAEVERELAACEPAAAGPFAAWYASTAKLGRLRWSFERLAAVAGNLPVLVVFVPYLDEPLCPELHERIRALVRGECERAGLEFVDPRPELGELDATLRLTPGDALHLGSEGHARLAHALAGRIRAALGR